MARSRRRHSRRWLRWCGVLVVALALGCSRGAGVQRQADSEGAPQARASGTPGEEPVATVLPEAPSVARARATGALARNCPAGKRELVWLVRNSPAENNWESGSVRPAFEEANPEVCLQIISVDAEELAAKKAAMAASGQLLHVWSPGWDGGGAADDHAAGLLADIAPLIQEDKLDVGVFVPGALRAYQAGGATFGLPFQATGSYVYYNKALLRQAGIPEPPSSWDDKSWTWDAMLGMAGRLTRESEEPEEALYGLQVEVEDIQGPPLMWGHSIWPEGAHETGSAEGVDLANERAVRAYQALHDAVFVRRVAPNRRAAEALEDLGGGLASGRVAMALSGGWGHWVWGDLLSGRGAFCAGVAPLPFGAPEAERRAVTYTDAWGIRSGLPEDQLRDAWELVKLLTSGEQMRAYSEATGTPPARTALLEGYYRRFERCVPPERMGEVFEGGLSHGREASERSIAGWEGLESAWRPELERYLGAREEEAAEVLPEIDARADRALERIGEEGEEEP